MRFRRLRPWAKSAGANDRDINRTLRWQRLKARTLFWFPLAVLAMPGWFWLANAIFSPESEPVVQPIVEAAPILDRPGAAGFAESFVRAWILDQDLKPFYPDAPTTREAASSTIVQHITAVSTKEHSEDYVEVEVIAVVAVVSEKSGGISAGERRQYSVGVVLGETSMAASSLPTQRPLGTGLQEVPLWAEDFRSRTAEEVQPFMTTVDGFLSAYITGSGEIGRFVHPNAPVHISPVSPAPFSEVSVDQVAVAALPDSNDVVLSIQFSGTTPEADSRSQQIHIVMRSRDQRWEVVQILGAAPLVPTSTN